MMKLKKFILNVFIFIYHLIYLAYKYGVKALNIAMTMFDVKQDISVINLRNNDIDDESLTMFLKSFYSIIPLSSNLSLVLDRIVINVIYFFIIMNR